jgi:small subunit ribosomal protein S6
LIDFEHNGDSNIINMYETELKRDERVMRFLNVKLDKDANDWAVKRRNKLKKEKA